LSSPGGSFEVPAPQMNQSQENIYGLLGIKTGADEWKDLYFIIPALDEQRILNVEYQPGSMTTPGGWKIPLRVSLTLGGWQKFEELQRSVKESRKAFVAMDFIDSKNIKKTTSSKKHFWINILFPLSNKLDMTSRTRSEASPWQEIFMREWRLK
jgi:hypothetical protein